MPIAGQPASLNNADGGVDLDYRIGMVTDRVGRASWFIYGMDCHDQSYWVGDGEMAPFDSRAALIDELTRCILADWNRVSPL